MLTCCNIFYGPDAILLSYQQHQKLKALMDEMLSRYKLCTSYKSLMGVLGIVRRCLKSVPVVLSSPLKDRTRRTVYQSGCLSYLAELVHG